MDDKKIIAVIQARIGSKRFPRKVLNKIGDKSVLELIFCRLSRCKLLDSIVFAIPDTQIEDELFYYLENKSYNVIRGEEKNVLKRFIQVHDHFKNDVFVRITGDCPFVDPCIVDECISTLLLNNYDYVSNVDPATFPDGFDVEVFTNLALKASSLLDKTHYNQEHVTPYLRESGKFRTSNIECKLPNKKIRLTLDYKRDLSVMRNVIHKLEYDYDADYLKIIKLNDEHPKLFQLNKMYTRNEGSLMSDTQKIKCQLKDTEN